MRLLRIGLCAIALGVACLAVPGAASAAIYQGPSGVTIPDAGPGSPYPSALTVDGVPGGIADVNVTMTIGHTCLSDVDVLLVAPSGARTLLLSGAGAYSTCPSSAFFRRITLDDEALPSYPCDLSRSGTFKPTNDPTNALGACPPEPEPFVAPAPPGPYPVSLAALDGGPATGSWQLFVVDDFSGDQGLVGSWSLALLPDVRCSGEPSALAEQVGTAGPDTIRGTREDDVLIGLGGKDKIRGLGGEDVICGGPGRDEVSGGSAKDELLGGSGKDELRGGSGRDRCNGGKGGDDARDCEKEKSL